MVGFRLLDSSFLVFKEILNSMEVLEIFELSQLSKRIRHGISKAKYRIKSIQIIEGKQSQRMDIYRFDENQCDLRLHFDQPFWRRDLRNYKNDILDLCVNFRDGNCITCEIDSPRDQLNNCLKYIAILFHNFEVSLSIEITRLEKSVKLYNNLKCNYLTIYELDEPRFISNAQIDKILEMTKPTHLLDIRCHVDPDFDYEKVLHFPRLRIDHAEQISLEHLQKVGAEVAFFGEHKLDEADMNKFILHWLSGNNSRLERLKLDGFKNLDWQALLMDIPHFEWDQKRRCRGFKSNFAGRVDTIDCAGGWDIQRDDGILATLVYSFGYLEFLVWHNNRRQ